MPPILEDDLGPLGTFLTALAAVFPEMKTDDVLREALSSMNVSNLDDVMKKIALNKIELDKKADAIAAATPAPVVPGAKPAQQQEQPTEAAQLKLLAEAIQNLAGKL
jgi:hypothetical protein